MKNHRNSKKILAFGMGGICLASAFAGCGGGNAGKSGDTEDLTGKYQKGKTVAEGDVTDEFAVAYADFSLNLLKESRKSETKDQKNTMVSPVSVMTALEMTRCGADGETEKQMDQVLYEGLSGDEGRENLMRFTDGLTDEKDAALLTANSIWFRSEADGIEPKQEFLESNGADFDADIFMAPFDEGTLKDINDWVDKKTDGNVPQILDEVPQKEKMYLINASSFEAKWDLEYNESDILENEEFTCADGTKKQVDLMMSTEWNYICGDHETGFKKEYQTGYSFVALLPDETMNMDDYVNQLDGTAFLKLMQGVREEKVYTRLPAFETDTKLELSDTLEALGMPLAFDEERAGFPGIFEDPAEQVWIGRVLHNTHIRVDAQGTKAGAATAVEALVKTAADGEPEDESKEVYLTRPFVYAVVEDDTNLPVFIGVVEDIGTRK